MIYVIGSLKNPKVRETAAKLRDGGHDVFDDWHGAGPDADKHWQEYEKARGHTFAEALLRPLAESTFALDFDHLDRADVGVLVMPAGKSAHLEAGWMAGRGKTVFVLLEEEPAEWDLMYSLAHDVCYDVDEILTMLGGSE